VRIIGLNSTRSHDELKRPNKTDRTNEGERGHSHLVFDRLRPAPPHGSSLGGIYTPMDEPITVSFRWTAKEMLLAQQLHMRYSKQGRKLRRIFMGCGILFVLLGIVGFVQQHNFFSSALPFFLLATVFLAMPLFIRRAVLKMYSQKPDRDMLVTYEISPDRLATRSDVASSDMVWRIILRAHRVPEGFLLYPTDRMFHWLPIHGFRDSAEVERFALLAKLKAQQYDHAN